MTGLPICCLPGTSGRGAGEGGCPPARAESLLLLRPDAADALDRQRRAAGFFGDLAVLFHDERARRLVAVETAEQFGWYAAVGALRVVFIDDVEKRELAFGIGSGLFGHGGLSSIRALLSTRAIGRNGPAHGCHLGPAGS